MKRFTVEKLQIKGRFAPIGNNTHHCYWQVIDRFNRLSVAEYLRWQLSRKHPANKYRVMWSRLYMSGVSM